MHHDDQEQPEDINHDVALAPWYALAAVIAAGPPLSVVFTVWLSMMPALGSRVQRVVYPFPDAGPAPSPAIMIDHLVGWKLGGEHAPLAPTP